MLVVLVVLVVLGVFDACGDALLDAVPLLSLPWVTGGPCAQQPQQCAVQNQTLLHTIVCHVQQS